MGLYLGGEKVKIYLDGSARSLGLYTAKIPTGDLDEPISSDYTRLEYIETDGNSWIDTGINARLYPNGIKYTIDFFTTETLSSDNNYLFGAYDGKSRSGNLSYHGKGSFRLLLGGGAVISKIYEGIAVGYRRYIEAYSTSTVNNATMSVNG